MYTRELDIIALIGQGKSSSEIGELLSKKYQTTARAIIDQYHRVLKSIELDTSEAKNELKTVLLTRADAIYQKAINVDNLKTALEATQVMAKLAGVSEKAELQQERPKFINISERKGPTLVKSGTDESGN